VDAEESTPICSLQQRTKGLSNRSELLNKTITSLSEMAFMHTPQTGTTGLTLQVVAWASESIYSVVPWGLEPHP